MVSTWINCGWWRKPNSECRKNARAAISLASSRVEGSKGMGGGLMATDHLHILKESFSNAALMAEGKISTLLWRNLADVTFTK